jgi:hypothetical protein
MVEKEIENLILTAQGIEITEHFVHQKLSSLATDAGFSRIPRWIRSDFDASKIIEVPEKGERK